MTHTRDPNTLELAAEGSEAQGHLQPYIGHLRPAWATRDPYVNKQTRNKNKQIASLITQITKTQTTKQG